jgi:serine/threonine-protein kinase SRPK3
MYTGNILFQLDDFDSWSDEQLYECMGHPVREEVVRLDGQPVENCAPAYTVHSGDLSRLAQRMLLFKLLLVDFGGAYFLEDPPLKTTTPSQYSAPEVLRSLGVSSASDVWALGCLTFELCAGYTLFKALFNPRQDVMKDMVAMLGKPPDKIWNAWEERSNYFDSDGNPSKRTEHSIIVQPYPLNDRIRDMAWLYPADGRKVDFSQRNQSSLETTEQAQMHDFLSKVFVFEPISRISVRDALAHPFLALMNFSRIQS